MSGHLYNLRNNWRRHSDAPTQSMESPSQIFIRLFGTTAEFKHTGLDSERQGNKRHYKGQLYSVFLSRDEGPMIPMTLTDLESLATTLQHLPPYYPQRAAILAHMKPQLELATHSLQAHQSTFAWLNPHATSPRRDIA